MAYRHTQCGTVTLVSLGGGALVILGIMAFTGWSALPLLIVGVLDICCLLFYALTVEIKDGVLECRFGPGLLRKRFQLAEVRSVEVVRNRWFYGWGIRRVPDGWLLNVSGFDAVAITLASGKKYRIGTDQPNELAEAIRQGAGLSA